MLFKDQKKQPFFSLLVNLLGDAQIHTLKMHLIFTYGLIPY